VDVWGFLSLAKFGMRKQFTHSIPARTWYLFWWSDHCTCSCGYKHHVKRSCLLLITETIQLGENYLQ